MKKYYVISLMLLGLMLPSLWASAEVFRDQPVTMVNWDDLAPQAINEQSAASNEEIGNSDGNTSVVAGPMPEKHALTGTASAFDSQHSKPAKMKVLTCHIHKTGERPRMRMIIGMFVGFLGVAMLVTPGGAGSSWDLHFILGAIAMQVGSIAWNLGSIRGKYYIKHVPLLTSASLQMLFGGVVVLAIGLATGEGARLVITPRTFAAAAYLTFFGSIVAYSAYVFALAHLPTAKMSLYAYVNPVVAVILGWIILSENLTWVSVLAMVIILGAVALVQVPGRKPVMESSETTEAADAA